ncbi:MAG: hypothetical protein IT518_05255 [Burkholderiales bacterium]|nr:hypothetical protein [Burkholderiales bacterium]
MSRRRAALVAFAVTACATDTFTAGEPRALHGVPVAPYEFHEECASLVAGDRIDYRFESTLPVHFEIYYRDGLAHVAPVSRDEATAGSGIHPVAFAHRHCLRWDAGRQGAMLDFNLRVLRAGK